MSDLNDGHATNSKEHWTNVLKLIIPFVLLVGAFEALGMRLMGVKFHEISAIRLSDKLFVIKLFSFAGTLLTIWIFRRYVDRASFRSLGFHFLGKKDILYGLLMGFIIMTIAFFGLLLFNEIQYEGLNFKVDQLIYSLLLFVVVALTEELLLRGYVLSNLMASMNKYAALVLSSLIFSLMHAANDHYGWLPAFELFIGGILLGLSYLYTRNLMFPIALHFSWNFFQGSIFGFNVSGLQNYSLINQSRLADNLWNGGAFGFEGSIPSVLLQLLAIVLIYYWYAKRSHT